MFQSLEIRPARNGYILTVMTEDETLEFVYDTHRKLMREVRKYVLAEENSGDE